MKRTAIILVTTIIVIAVAYIFGVEAGGLIGSFQTKKWKEKREQQRQIILDKKEALQIGQKLPNYFFYDLDGNLVEFEKVAHGQKQFVICYLDSDCGSCREQLDIFSKIQVPADHLNAVIIISHSNPFELKEIRDSYKIKFPILYDYWNQYGIHLKIKEFPFNIIADSQLIITNLTPNVLLEDEVKEVVDLR